MKRTVELGTWNDNGEPKGAKTKEVEFCENVGCGFNNNGMCTSDIGECFGYYMPNNENYNLVTIDLHANDEHLIGTLDFTIPRIFDISEDDERRIHALFVELYEQLSHATNRKVGTRKGE